MENKTFIEVNLSNIKSNYLHCNSLLKINKSRAMPVLKSNAYGLGIYQVSRALYEIGVREFIVVDFFEALQITEALKNTFVNVDKKDFFVYVLRGFDETDIDDFIQTKTIPIICDIRQLELWYTRKTNLAPGVFLETGLNRFCLRSQELETARDKKLLNIDFSMVMSHLSSPLEDKGNYNIFQKNNFENLIKDFDLRYNFKSLGASNTLFNLDNSYYYDAIRLGSGLYGFKDIDNSLTKDLKNVYSAYSKIVKLFSLQEGESLSYSKSFVAKRKTKVAILPFGYSHGLPRYFSNRFQLFSQKKDNIEYYDVIGNIAMDFCAIDITDSTHDLQYDDIIYFCNENRNIMDIQNQFSKYEETTVNMTTRLSGGFETNEVFNQKDFSDIKFYPRNTAKNFYRYDYTVNSLKLKSNIKYID